MCYAAIAIDAAMTRLEGIFDTELKAFGLSRYMPIRPRVRDGNVYGFEVWVYSNKTTGSNLL